MAVEQTRSASQPAVTRAGAAPRPARTAAPRADILPLLVEAVVDYAIFLVSPDGTVASWNRGAQRIKGYDASEIIGRHIRVFYTAEDALAGKPEHNLREAMRHGHFTEQAWRLRADGTRFWADVVLTALRNDDGELAGFAKVTRDLTERRASEARERELAIEREARAAAEKALRTRDRFLSIASHELKTPVASLQVAVDALRISQERGLLDGTRLTSLLERIDRAAARMTTLVGELLDVSRLTSDEAPLVLREVDLAELVQEVTERYSGIVRSGRIRTDLEPAHIRGDPDRLDQVVSNLLDNALKYSSADAPVDLQLRAMESGVVLEVRDRGRGLDMQDPQLFEPFGRGMNVADQQGLGLGLFISQRIAERHGGRISAENCAPQPGTKFTLRLPTEPAAA